MAEVGETGELAELSVATELGEPGAATELDESAKLDEVAKPAGWMGWLSWTNPAPYLCLAYRFVQAEEIAKTLVS